MEILQQEEVQMELKDLHKIHLKKAMTKKMDTGFAKLSNEKRIKELIELLSKTEYSNSESESDSELDEQFYLEENEEDD